MKPYYGTITITLVLGLAASSEEKPDGRKRTIVFKDGKATGADTSQADPGTFEAEKRNDINIVRVGEERYEIFDTAIFGG